MQVKALFVFSMGGLKQNVNSILISDTVVHALSHGSLHFILRGSLFSRLIQIILLAVTENQLLIKNGLKSYHGDQNQGYHVKEHKKLYQKLVSKMTLDFV